MIETDFKSAVPKIYYRSAAEYWISIQGHPSIFPWKRLYLDLGHQKRTQYAKFI